MHRFFLELHILFFCKGFLPHVFANHVKQQVKLTGFCDLGSLMHVFHTLHACDTAPKAQCGG